MKLFRALSAIALAATLAGCSESTGNNDPDGSADQRDSVVVAPKSPQDVTVADLVGTWVAQSLVYTAVGNTTQQFDLVAAGGSVTQVIAAGGGFTGTTVLPDGGGTQTYTGTLTVANGVLTQNIDGGAPTLTWSIRSFADGTMSYDLTGTIGGDVTWDFGGGLVPASIRSVVKRQ